MDLDFEQKTLKLVNPEHLPKIAPETRISLIRNSLEVTEKFQRDAQVLEKKIDELDCGLVDIGNLLSPDKFRKDSNGEKLEKEIAEVLAKIEKLRKIHSLDAQVHRDLIFTQLIADFCMR